MNPILIIAKKEWLSILRDKRFLMLSVAYLLLIVLAVLVGFRAYHQQQKAMDHAQKEKWEQWTGQEAKHPHIAAHFGTFAFKPKTTLSFFDFGLDTYTGTYNYLEAHKQNNMQFKPVQEYHSSLRFGELSGATIVLILFPLIIVFFSFSSVSGEREERKLNLLLCQGISLKQVLWGKILGIYCLVFIPTLVIFFFISVICLVQEGVGYNWSTLLSTYILFFFYAIYLLILVVFSVLVSALNKSSKTALVMLLAFWVISVTFLPKAASSLADALHPLPSEFEFRHKIYEDVKNGLDGHNPKVERLEALKKELLEKYNVKTEDELPVNIEGYLMQQGEEYTSKAYDKHFHKLQERLKQQNNMVSLTGILSPYISIRNLSMGLTGTDIYHHIHFQRYAEDYRRNFVQTLNEDMLLHSHYGDWEYKSNPQLWKKSGQFKYVPIPLKITLKYHSQATFILLGWLLLLIIGVNLVAEKLKII